MAPRSAQLTPGAPIELRSKIRNRFYEPILLDSALAVDNEALRQRQAADASAETAGNQEKLFHDFLNKVSQVCDSKKCGGDTVTSFVVLAHLDNAPQPIEYRFACNQRNAAQLRNTTKFVVRLLETIGNEQDGGAGSAVLKQILQFNRSRVKVYLASLEKQCGPCIRSLGDALAQQDPTRLLRDRVHALEETLAKVKLLLDQDDEDYFLACNQAYLVIQDIVKPEMANLTMVMAREGHMAQRLFWCELRHAAARFISYYRAVGTFRQARQLWPELFVDFTVKPIVSSSPWTNVFKRTRGASAHDIIGRMTSDRQKIAEYRAQAAQLEAVDLNERIRENAGRIKPIVHAEVLVLQSLVDDNIVGDINKFFHRYHYIGSSKPTCRLCWYYFETHDSDVKVRSSHWNLYPNWRVPDMYNREDVGRMEGIMNKISDRIRGDVFRSLSQRVSLRRPHDSNSDRTYPTFLLANTAQTPDNLLSAFGNMQIQDQNLQYSQAAAAGMPLGNATLPSSSDSSPESRGDTPTILEDLNPTFVRNGEEEVDNDDDDTGGASLV